MFNLSVKSYLLLFLCERFIHFCTRKIYIKLRFNWRFLESVCSKIPFFLHKTYSSKSNQARIDRQCTKHSYADYTAPICFHFSQPLSLVLCEKLFLIRSFDNSLNPQWHEKYKPICRKRCPQVDHCMNNFHIILPSFSFSCHGCHVENI